MGVPVVYRRSGESSVTSFDFYDIAEGTGIKTFYGATTDNPVSDLSGALLTSAVYSSGINPTNNPTGWETRNNQTASWTSIISKTFKTTFNMPKLIKGTLYANVPTRIVTPNGTDSSNHYIDVTIYKNDTSVATASGANMYFLSGTSTIDNYMSLVPVTLPLTSFKKGDILKAKIQLFSKGDGTSIILAMGHDPMGRVPSSIYSNGTSKLIVNVPFVIDL